MLVAAAHLLDRETAPSRARIADALSGVLCRCTGYSKIVDSVESVAGAPCKVAMPQAGKAVGARIARLDGRPKVTGQEAYGADAIPPDAVFVRAIRSPYHRAGFSFGGLDAFIAATPGIIRVLTAADIPGRNIFGVIPPFADQPVFATGETRFRGEAVAAIVGERSAIADFDESAFPVVWTERPAVLTPEQAEEPSAALIHENRPGNILVRGRVIRGDTGAAVAAAAVVVEGEFTTGFVEHAYIEPEAGWAGASRTALKSPSQRNHLILTATMSPPFSESSLAPCGSFPPPAAAASARSSISRYSPSWRSRPGFSDARRPWSIRGRNPSPPRPSAILPACARAWRRTLTAGFWQWSSTGSSIPVPIPPGARPSPTAYRFTRRVPMSSPITAPRAARF